METNESVLLPTTSYDLSKALKSNMPLSSKFSSQMPDSSFQQILNNNDQDQASSMLMFLYGDSAQDSSNLGPYFNEQVLENSDIKRPTEKKKRCQVRNACVNCQKSNKKCDEMRPCSRCVKHNLTDSCINSKRKKRQKGIKRGPYKRRKQESTVEKLLLSPIPTMVPLLDTTPVTSDMDTSFSDFTGQPLFEFDTVPRFMMPLLPALPYDSVTPYHTLLPYGDGHLASPTTLMHPIHPTPIKNQDHSVEFMSTLLDDHLMKGLVDHSSEQRVEPSCRPLSMNQEADLGTLASLCAAVLGED